MGSSIKIAGDKLSQLQKKGESLKIGAALGKSFQDLKAETLRVRQEYEKTGYKSAELGNRLRALQRATREAGREAQKYGFELGKAAKQTKYLETMSAQAEARVGRMQARMARRQERSQLRGELTGTVALGTAVFGYPIKKAVEFQQSIAEVGAITRASAEDMKKLEVNAREMGRTTQFTASQAAGAQKYLGMAGFNTAQIITAMPGMMNLAAAGAMDLGRAADIASNILTGFNMKQEEMGRVADVLTLAANSSNTSVEQMGYAFKYVAPIAKELGFNIEQSAAVISKLSDAGIQGEMAGTTMRGMLTSLVDPTKEAAELLDYLGVKTMDAKGELRALPDILRDMDAAMSKRNWGGGEKSRANQAIFGARAGTGASAIRNAVLSGDLDNLTKKYNDAGGAAEEAARRMNETALGSLRRLGSAAESVGICIGNVFLPPLADAADKLATVATKVSEFAEKNPKITKMLVGAAAGFIGLKAASIVGRIGISHLMDGFSLLNDGFQMIRPSTIQAVFGVMRMKGVGGVVAGLLGPLSKLKGGFLKDVGAIRSAAKFVGTSFVSVGRGAVTGFKLLGGGLLSFVKIIGVGIKAVGAAMVANPVILAIGVVVALVAGAVYLIWKHWDKVKVRLGAFGEGIKARWKGAIEWIGKTVSGIGEAIKAPFVAAFEWIGSKIDWIKSKWEGFKSVFSSGSSAAIGGPNGNAAIGASLPGHAIGGVFNREHIAAFSEGNKEEAVIALEGDKDRARSIWTYSGEKLGMFDGGRTSGTETPSRSVYIAIAPGAIQVNAAPGMDESVLADEVLRRLERFIKQRQGRSYSDVAFAR